MLAMVAMVVVMVAMAVVAAMLLADQNLKCLQMTQRESLARFSGWPLHH
jgi:hypothetical protein